MGINPVQMLHVLVINSILFAVHIKEKVFDKMERYAGREINIKVIFIVNNG